MPFSFVEQTPRHLAQLFIRNFAVAGGSLWLRDMDGVVSVLDDVEVDVVGHINPIFSPEGLGITHE